MQANVSILAAGVLAASMLGFWGAAQAAPNGQVEAKLSASKVVMQADGKESLQPAEQARPGDTLEYRAVYRNNGNNPAKNLLATLPVPQGLQFMPGQAMPHSASLDGKSYAAVPLKRQVKLADGKTEERAVPYNEYRYLQWKLGDLAPGANTAVSARMQVANVSVAEKGVGQ